MRSMFFEMIFDGDGYRVRASPSALRAPPPRTGEERFIRLPEEAGRGKASPIEPVRPGRYKLAMASYQYVYVMRGLF